MSEQSTEEIRLPSRVWHPLAWLIVGLFAVALPYGLLVALAQASGPLGATLLPLLGAGLAIAAYRFVMVHAARRPLPELQLGTLGKEALLGVALGAAFIGGSAGLIALFGGYRFGWAPAAPIALLQVLGLNLSAAIVEELIFRGVGLQAIEKLGGSFTALAVTSLFFGVAHLGNPNATAWSAFAIACEAGLLLGAAFLWRRHLGFVIGLHFAWNMAEALLGIPVSGHASPGLFATTLAGSDLLTGGEFGLEASLVPVLASFFLSVPMLLLARRRPREA